MWFPHVRRGRVYRTSGPQESVICGLLAVLLMMAALIAVPWLASNGEKGHEKRVAKLSRMLEVGFKEPAVSKVGDPVYLNGKVDATVTDDKFGAMAVNAVGLRRVTEYCQWREFSTRRCETCERQVQAKDGSRATETYDCNCYYEYTYMKGWTSTPIPSVFFDQAAAHYNPLRDPFPSTSIAAPFATVFTTENVAAHVDRSILRRVKAKWRRLAFGPAPKKKSFFFSKNDETRTYRAVSLLSRELPENFVYVGDYFYSPYEPSVAETLLKGFFQYVEGTLFDWQLSDLFARVVGSCHAGDIRLHYEVQDPKKLSIVSSVKRIDKEQGRRLLYLGDSSGVTSIVHAGKRRPGDMIAIEAQDSRPLLTRLLLYVWAFPTACLLGAYLGFDVARSGFLLAFFSATSLFATILGVFWLSYWPSSVLVSEDNTLVLLVVVALVGGMYAVPKLQRSHAVPGARAVWCMLARTARLPPDWRVEAAYRPDVAQIPHPNVPSRGKRVS